MAGPTLKSAVAVLGFVVSSALLAPLLANDTPLYIRGRFQREVRDTLRQVRAASSSLMALVKNGERASESTPGALQPSYAESVEHELRFLHARAAYLASNMEAHEGSQVAFLRAALERVRREWQAHSSVAPPALAELVAAAHELGAVFLEAGTPHEADWIRSRSAWPLFARISDFELYAVLASLLAVATLGRSIWRRGQHAPDTHRRHRKFAARWLALLAFLAVPLLGVLGLRCLAGRDSGFWSYKQAIARGDIEVEKVVFAPVAFGPLEVNRSELLQPPAWWKTRAAPPAGTGEVEIAAPYRHLLGTDESGRDVLAQVLWGSRASLTIALLTTSLLTVIGIVVGAAAGFFRGWTDSLLSRLIEVVQSIPAFFAILAVLAFAERSVLTIAVVMAALLWTNVARLVRAEFLRLGTLDFTVASRALGSRPVRTIVAHLLPNAIDPVLVAAAFAAAGAVIVESGLSFLGLGVPDDTASWGTLLAAARRAPNAWWLSVFPGLLIFATVLGFNGLGEALRGALDPHSRAPTTREAARQFAP
ncbi:MAG: ABC transporter permease [Planctomycetota bacterium]